MECSFGFCKRIVLQTDTAIYAQCSVVSDYDFEDIDTLKQSKRDRESIWRRVLLMVL